MHYVCGCEVTEFDVFSKKIKKDSLGGKSYKKWKLCKNSKLHQQSFPSNFTLS